MSWTAPEITRQRVPYVAGERQMLEAWLDFHRQTLLHKCSGLTAGQLRQRAAPPSDLSLHAHQLLRGSPEGQPPVPRGSHRALSRIP